MSDARQSNECIGLKQAQLINEIIDDNPLHCTSFMVLNVVYSFGPRKSFSSVEEFTNNINITFYNIYPLKIMFKIHRYS